VGGVQADKLLQDGWTILDVRVEANYNAYHIKDSVSIPLYRPVMGRSNFDQAKRLAMALFAMSATGTPQCVERQVSLVAAAAAGKLQWLLQLRRTPSSHVHSCVWMLRIIRVQLHMVAGCAERDVEFAQNVVKQLGQDAKIIVACDIGGTLSTKVECKHKKKVSLMSCPVLPCIYVRLGPSPGHALRHSPLLNQQHQLCDSHQALLRTGRRLSSILINCSLFSFYQTLTSAAAYVHCAGLRGE
jgi:rhodanese-related sulfurtransferase